MTTRTPEELEEKLHYDFKNKELLITALTHSSYANESKTPTLYNGIFCRPGGQCLPLQWALVLRLSRRGAHCAPAAYILVPAISNGRA